ncbi:MAG: hypothetical protein AABY41_04250 [Nitrospirota bacterium]
MSNHKHLKRKIQVFYPWHIVTREWYRHHLHESVIQKAVRTLNRATGYDQGYDIPPPISSFRIAMKEKLESKEAGNTDNVGS